MLAVFSPGVLAEEPPVGLEQSPVNITADALIVVNRPDVPKLQTRSKTSLTITNTGSPGEHATIRADVPAGAARLHYGGDWYDPLQFHWHTPSEHQIDGEITPMEMHLVHRKAGSTGLNDLLVIGVFIVEGRAHRELDQIISQLPAQPGPTVHVPRFDLNKLLPNERPSFRYPGSLTTPPFSEGVQWIVLAEPISMSAHQIESFVALFEEGNTRPPQPLNDRVIATDRNHPHRHHVDLDHRPGDGHERQPVGK